MKHIKKKFLHEVPVTTEILTFLNKHKASLSNDPKKDVKNFSKDHTLLFVSDDNLMYKGFHVTIGKEVRIIPEPDPILVYFHTAYMSYTQLAEKKEILIN